MRRFFKAALSKPVALLVLPLLLAGCYYEPGYYTRGDAYYGTSSYYDGDGYYYGPGYYDYYGPGYYGYGPSFGLGYYYYDHGHKHYRNDHRDWRDRSPQRSGWAPVDGRRPGGSQESRPPSRGNVSGPWRGQGASSPPSSRGPVPSAPMRGMNAPSRGSSAPTRSAPTPRSAPPSRSAGQIQR